MDEYRVIDGRTYANAGMFPKKFAQKYAKEHRARGWWVRLEKLKPPYEHNRKGDALTYRVWLGGSNRPWRRK